MAGQYRMTIVGLDHVQLAMPPGEEDQARKFYTDLLGIPEIAKPAALAARGGCWFEHDAVRLHLGVGTDFVPARKAYPALLTDDLATLLKRVRASGFRVIEDRALGDVEQPHRAYPVARQVMAYAHPGRLNSLP
jgi:hypothetical protein